MKIKIAIQKSGRLQEDSLKLLKECGLGIENPNDKLKVEVRNFPAEIFYLRNSDIPQYVEDGIVDLGIIGENEFVEQQKDIHIIQKLGFSKCRLSLALPKNITYKGLEYFNEKRIATSYPNTLKGFLEKNKIFADIHEISGSVEIAPAMGLADAICDLVSSGNTLFVNGMVEVEEVLKSEACLVSTKTLSEENQIILEKLMFRLQSVLKARNNKYILLNAPTEKIDVISRILPAMKSPTILPLAVEGWCSIHSVISEDEFWQVIDQLKEAGAEGILVIPIEKMVG